MFSLRDGWAAKLGSTLASLMFLWAVVREHFPRHLERNISNRFTRISRLFQPYVHIKFPEYVGERFKRSEAYVAVEYYLTTTCSSAARRLKAEIGKDSASVDLSMDDHEEVTDSFRGAKLWWSSNSVVNKSTMFSFYPASDERRYYTLVYHRRDRDLVHGEYLQHVMEQGKANRISKRQRKLYTNKSDEGYRSYWKGSWSHVAFEHPATFDTIAMDPARKQDILEDLRAFSESKEYYRKIGKAWKRGYLLHGPPGTGKSSMVAAIANFLDYDVYDLELTAVKNNTELRKLLIETTSKAVIVIEDIDCSLDLTGQRKKKEEEKEEKEAEGEKKVEAAAKKKEKEGESKVTLSGLLNFIDGLWSACGGEKVIVFTTNHLEKLDEALIRRGRMDKHIELSYCCFEAFRVLAKNYLDVKEHRLFGRVEELLGEVKVTPADVAECLMPKRRDGDMVGRCLEDLIAKMEETREKEKQEKEAREKEGQESLDS